MSRKSVDFRQTRPDQAAEGYQRSSDDAVEGVVLLLAEESTGRSAVRMLGVHGLAASNISAFAEFATMMVAVADPSTLPADSVERGSGSYGQVETTRDRRESGMLDFLSFSNVTARQFQRDVFADDPALELEQRFFEAVETSRRSGAPVTGLPTPAEVLAAGRWALDAYERTIDLVLPILTADPPPGQTSSCTAAIDQGPGEPPITVPCGQPLPTNAPVSAAGTTQPTGEPAPPPGSVTPGSAQPGSVTPATAVG